MTGGDQKFCLNYSARPSAEYRAQKPTLTALRPGATLVRVDAASSSASRQGRPAMKIVVKTLPALDGRTTGRCGTADTAAGMTPAAPGVPCAGRPPGPAVANGLIRRPR